VKNIAFAKLVVFVCSLVPLTMLIIDNLTGRAGADPAFYIMRCTGLCALIFLVLSLSVTPLRRITGRNYWSAFRRMLGLYAFFYASLHLLTYISMYTSGSLSAFLRDAAKRPFIFLGISAFLIMVPLAATSTAWAIKKLGGKKWKLLHKIVYLAAISASIHYFMQPKLVTLQPLLFAAVLWGLVLFRPIAWARDKWFPAKPHRPQPAAAVR
jgi:methionine sulfoxide reductase heme-binding subunit